MKYTIVPPSRAPRKHDALIACILADKWPDRDSATGRALDRLGLDPARIRRRDSFEAGPTQHLYVTVAGNGDLTRVVLLGLGRRGGVDPTLLRRRFERVGGILRARGVRKAVVHLPDDLPMEMPEVLESAVTGLALGTGDRVSYASKKKKRGSGPTEVCFVIPGRTASASRRAVERASTVGDIVIEARSWVSEPPNVLGPVELARRASALCTRAGATATTWNAARLRRERCHLIDAVGKGSERGPRLVRVEWKPRGRKLGDLPRIAIVGKGVVFDTGGLSLKPPKGMPGMKHDMAGAATAAGAVAAAAALEIPVRVTAWLPIVENTPSSRAYRPSDVITGRAGKSVEILNTDAEGRLIMADALALAAETKPRAIIDVATLTGACLVALGPFTAGLWSNRDALAREIEQAARQSGESLWRMPLLEELAPYLRTGVADVRNSSLDPHGGAVFAALFLRSFVDGQPWAHLDIAGPASIDKRTEVGQRGATGYGITTLVRYMRNLAESG